MRHRKRNKRLGRNRSQRQALVKSLAQNLVRDQRIKTTLVKAREARRVVENLITLAKTDSLHSRRIAYRILNSRDLVKQLFTEIGPLFKNRKGGYTRIIPYRQRKGDNSPLVFLEFTELSKEAKEKKAKKARKEQKPAKPGRPAREPKVKDTSPPAAKERPVPEKKKPSKEIKPKKFFGGLRKLLKKERDSL